MSKIGLIYVFYVGLVWFFDYIYTPWLAIKFGYWMFFVLCPSIFLISLSGLWAYNYFGEDVFFIEKINQWLYKKSKLRFINNLKNWAKKSDKVLFALIAIWWGPLHAYLFFKEKNGDVLVIKAFAKGSIQCAVFWGIVVDIIILTWQIGKKLLALCL